VKLKNIVIVGAGPAGLFAADVLADSFDVTILESRDYVGGSGLHSDGKLNFNPKVGGDLTEFLAEGDAWDLVFKIRDIFRDLGVEVGDPNEMNLHVLESSAAKAGIKFINIIQGHIGSDGLPEVMARLQGRLEDKGVKLIFNTRVTDISAFGGRVDALETDGESYSAGSFIVAPGRIGSACLTDHMKRLGVKLSYNPIDIGVRVEVPNEVMDEIIQGYRCWDPKFHIYTPSYDDFVRTFCVCPRGFVVREAYEADLFGVNGYSMRKRESSNTNFALLTRVKLTEPLENTTEYGRNIAQLTNTLGGKHPIIQRLGDLRSHRRSTWERIHRSYVEPTLTEVTPGDISMSYPRRIVRDLLEGLEMLDKVIPGVNSDSTLIYAPEIKFYAMRVQTDKHLRTAIPNLYVAGDGAGVSRGIVGAAATGIIAARGVSSESI
jgi:uncharacterized FAD-dependent dehydrogenase